METRAQKIKAALLFLFLPVLITWPLITRMGWAIYGDFFLTDMRGAVWSLWWRQYALQNHLDQTLCPFLSAPFGISMQGQPVFWMVSGLLNAMLRVFSPVLTLNILMFLSWAMTGFVMALLAHRLTKNSAVAIFAGVVFVLAPYHTSKVMDFGFFFLGNWFALCVYQFVLLRESVTPRRVLLAGLVFAVTCSFNFYNGFFAFVFILALLLAELRRRWVDVRPGQESRSHACWKWVLAVCCALIVSFLVIWPSLAGTLKAKEAAGSSDGYERPFSYLTAQSARPLSYLLPASTHPIFGGFTKKMFGSFFYGRGATEQTLYLGWIPLILAFVAYRQWRYRRTHPDHFPDYRKSEDNFYIGFFLFMAWVAFFFSFPPILDLGIGKIHFPSYMSYKILPMLRAYARFGIVVLFCVGVLAAYGLKAILEKTKSEKLKKIFLCLAMAGVVFEFMNVPPFRVTALGRVPEVYQWIASRPGDFIIAEYPMAKGALGEAQDNYHYLFYQTIHQKKMVNGAPMGSSGYDVKMKILRVDAPQTPLILKELGVKYVILHKDIYQKGYRDAVDVIGEAPNIDQMPAYRLTMDFGDVSVYEIGTET